MIFYSNAAVQNHSISGEMKITLSLLLSTATMTLTSVLSPTPQPESNLPDPRFRVELSFQPAFLPVNPAFINILDFMRSVAQDEFEEQVEPRTYSALMYRQVQIMTHGRTESRFLLWGIYLAATDMVKFNRFNNVMVKLYWEGNIVGHIDLMVNPDLVLPGTIPNGTRSVIDDGGELSAADISNKTNTFSVKRRSTAIVQNTTGSKTADNVLVINSVKTWNTVSSNSSTSLTPFLPNALLAPRLTITFDRVGGATKLTRNDVFLTFYAALLHLARFPVENDMRLFNSKVPTIDLRVSMFESGLGCLVLPSSHVYPIQSEYDQQVLIFIVGW